jgi:hypothetical protein
MSKRTCKTSHVQISWRKLFLLFILIIAGNEILKHGMAWHFKNSNDKGTTDNLPVISPPSFDEAQ